MTIPELIVRLETADGPDRELDACIAFATGEFDFKLKYGFEDCHIERGARREDDFVEVHVVNKGKLIYTEPYPRYTASIDAAVQLCERVLPEWIWGVVKKDLSPSRYVAFVASKARYAAHVEAEQDRCSIALCIAILRALQPKEGE